MGVGSISQEMLKNPHVDEKPQKSVHNHPLVEDMTKKTV